jgi:hypothetical protein
MMKECCNNPVCQFDGSQEAYLFRILKLAIALMRRWGRVKMRTTCRVAEMKMTAGEFAAPNTSYHEEKRRC